MHEQLLRTERDRQRKARKEARALGNEVLTPQAAMSLFGISAAAVRQARLAGHVETRLTCHVTDRPVHLLSLSSAIDYWQYRKREDFEEVLESMRQNGHLLAVGMVLFNVLHTKPFVVWESAKLGHDC